MFLLLICFIPLSHELSHVETMCTSCRLNCYNYNKSIHYKVIYFKDIDKKIQHVLCDSFLELAQIETLQTN